MVGIGPASIAHNVLEGVWGHVFALNFESSESGFEVVLVAVVSQTGLG